MSASRSISVSSFAQASAASSSKPRPAIEPGRALPKSTPDTASPLTRLTDFARWSGHEAKIELNAPQEGRKRIRATLLGLDGSDVVLDAAGQRLKFPFRAIAEAKLVLTDKLIQEDLKARKQ